MPGKWCCLSTWRLPEPFQVLLRVTATAVLLPLGLAAAGVAVSAEIPAPTAVDGGAETLSTDTALVQSVTRVLGQTHPLLNVKDMLDHYSRTSPDILSEIRSQVEPGAHDPGPYLRRLADHFGRMEQVRRRNPTEFSRLVALEQLESRARMLGQRIQQLTEMAAESGVSDRAMAKTALATAKEELRSALERSFEASQQNQRIELNRLDAELRAMRRLIDEREAKRDLILGQRYLQLSGQEMPTGAGPVAKDN